jgi:NADP-dependent 3-hydroxy acid dehydrogenase YdfG
MADFKDLVVIVTGASSGIGAATARTLAERGAKVMLAARRVERLEQLHAEIEDAGGVANVHACDVTQRGDVEALVAATEKELGPVDVMINNAGVMLLSALAKTKVDEWDQMIDVNIKGLLYGVAAVLPKMLERGHGHIINVSSIAGHKVFPGGGVYCATKTAVRFISEGIRAESGDKVRSTIISPGAIATELAEHITDPDAKKGVEPALEVAIDPQAIAEAICFAISQPNDVDVNEVTVRPTAQDL